MSTIKGDLLQNRLGTSHPTVTKAVFLQARGTAHMSGGTPANTESFGVSSVTDTALGQLGFNWTNTFVSVYYTAVAITMLSATQSFIQSGTSKLVGSNVFLNVSHDATVYVDPAQWDVLASGVLA